ALLLAEAGVRLWAPQAPAGSIGGPAGDDLASLNRGLFTEPGDHPVHTDEYDAVVHVNAHGFVDVEWGPRRPGVARVLLVGDSFVQAAQVDLDDGLGRVVDRALGPAVEVYSAGVPGAGTGTALLLARRLLPALQPDVVVYAWTTSNDVLNNDPLLDDKPDKPYFDLVDGALVRRVAAGDPPTAGPLFRASALVRLVTRTWRSRAEVRQRIARGDGLPVDLRIHDPAGGPEWEHAWAVTEALVAALAAEVTAAGAEFAVALVPDAVQATDAGRAAAIAAWPQLADWDLDRAHARAAEIASRHGVVIDLRPALHAAGGGLYLPVDGHWTRRGHAVAGAALARGLVPLLPPPADRE
ncbi:MAG: hypothetical protein D6798_00280, partial [Deltaproteobacteria bacterium]